MAFHISSQLNPAASEFVPLSPQRLIPTNSVTPTKPFTPDLHSPRKGSSMDIVSDKDLGNDISKQRYELESNVDDMGTIDTSNNENGTTCRYQYFDELMRLQR
jgi:Ataxin-2 C-terminal region